MIDPEFQHLFFSKELVRTFNHISMTKNSVTIYYGSYQCGLYIILHQLVHVEMSKFCFWHLSLNSYFFPRYFFKHTVFEDSIFVI